LKVLLLNPTVDFNKQFGTLKKFYTPIPSIGLAYIGGLLLENNFEVVGLDSFMACHSIDDMFHGIVSQEPDVLGISLLTPSAPLVDKLLVRLRKEMPDLKIVLGNIHASVFAEHYLQKKWADFVVHHEGEVTMLELLQAVQKGKDTKNILGISYLDPHTGNVVKTSKRPWITKEDLMSMPLPAWELFPVDQFLPDIRLQTHREDENSEVQVLPIIASRGCPFNCTFCSPKNSIGNAYRLRSPKNVCDEMEYFHKKWGVNSFYCMDLTFPISEKKGLEFCNHLIERKLPINWACETRVSAVTEKLLGKMKESGCFRVDFGIECGNQKMLDSIKKQFKIQHVIDAANACNNVGLEAEGLFIIGLPGETRQDTLDTIKFALSLNLAHIKLNLFVPYPGCDIFEDLVKNNELLHFEYDAYTSYPTYGTGKIAFVPKGRTYKELIQLQKRGMRKAFFRKRVILRELKKFKLKNIGQYWSAVKGLLLTPPADTTSDRLQEESQI